MANYKTLEIVDYLIDLVRMNSELPQEDELLEKLTGHGYDQDKITEAFNWFYVIADLIFDRNGKMGNSTWKDQIPPNRIIHLLEKNKAEDAVIFYLSNLFYKGFLNYRQYENMLHTIYIADEHEMGIEEAKKILRNMMEVQPEHILQSSYIEQLSDDKFKYN